MRAVILYVLSSILFVYVAVGQINQIEHGICETPATDWSQNYPVGTQKAISCSGNFTYCSMNGSTMAPTGNIGTLNIFVNIIYDQDQAGLERDPMFGNTDPTWPAATVEGINTNLPTYLLDFMDVNPSATPHGTMTRLYHEASFGTLNIYGDFVVVNVAQSRITPIDVQGDFGLQDLARAVFEILNDPQFSPNGELQTLYGSHPISYYDQMQPGAVFQPKTPGGNNRIDLIQFFVRNSIKDGVVKDQNGNVIDTYNYGGVSGGSGFNAVFNDAQGDRLTVKINGVDYAHDLGTVQGAKTRDISQNPTEITYHELSHHLFGGNNFHTSGGNHYGASLITFLGIEHGYGLMGNWGSSLVGCNGYERLRLGWTSSLYNPNNFAIQANEIESDVDVNDGNVSFVLRDFITTGDAVRIKLPYKDPGAYNQYIWLENHQVGLNGKLDFLQKSNTEPCRDQGLPGIYAYVQIGKDVLESNVNTIVDGGESDNLRVISAEGSWDVDYLGQENSQWCLLYPTDYHANKQKEPNPFTGRHDQESHYDRSGSSQLTRNEGYAAEKKYFVDGTTNDNYPTLGDNLDAFTGNSIMDIGSNPSPVNMRTFYHDNIGGSDGMNLQAKNQNKNSVNTYLSGLRIDMEDLGNGTFRVTVYWDDYEVKNDTRWCGNIILNEEVELLSNNTIQIVPGLSATQIDKDPISGNYAPPTTFTCEDGSIYHMNDNSTTLVYGPGTEFILKSGSELEIHAGAEFRVGLGAKLIVEDGAKIALHNGGKLIIEDQGEMEYENTNILRPIQVGSTTLPGTQAEWFVDGLLTVKNNTVVDLDGNGYLRFGENYQLDLQGNSYFRIIGNDINEKVLHIDPNTNLSAGAKSIFISDGQIHNEGVFTISNNTGIFTNVSFAGDGITADDVNVLQVIDSKSIGNRFMIDALNNTSPIVVINSEMTNCNYGIKAANSNSLNIRECKIEGSVFAGVRANDVSVVNVLGSSISNNEVGIEVEDVGQLICDETSTSVSKLDGNITAIEGSRSFIYLRNGTTVNDNITHAVNLTGSYTQADTKLIIGDFGCVEMKNNSLGGTSVITGQDYLFEMDAVTHAPNNSNVVLASNFFNPDAGYFLDVCYSVLSTIEPSSVDIRGHYWGQGVIPNISMFNLRQSCIGNATIPIDISQYTTDCLGGAGCGSCDLAEDCDNDASQRIANGTSITTAVQYQGDYHLEGRLVVRNGGVLTLSEANMTMEEDAKIIVRRGGQLIIESSVLEACSPGKSWKGIEIRGNISQGQILGNQGYLSVNKSLIRDADVAVYVGRRDGNDDFVSGSGGGIVEIQNSIFKDNHNQVIFKKYNLVPSVSYIIESTFDQSNQSPNYSTLPKHILVQKLIGLKISDNTFIAGNKGVKLKNTLNTRLLNNQFTHVMYPIISKKDEGLIVSHNTLSKMVRGMNVVDGTLIHVVDNTITDFEKGVKFKNVDETSVSRNYFASGIYGIILKESAGVTILENRFEDVKIPIEKRDSKTDPKMEAIAGNEFVDCEKAIYLVDGDNTKLDITCNQFVDYTEYGVKTENTTLKDQGTMLEGAGNTFVPNSPLPENCVNHTGNGINYYYDPSYVTSFTAPGVMTANVTPVGAGVDKNCVSSVSRLSEEVAKVFEERTGSKSKTGTPQFETTGMALSGYSLDVYPNPNSGFFTVRISGMDAETLVVFNVLGEQVDYQVISSDLSKADIQLTTETTGVYLIQMKSESGQMLSKRVVVK